METLLESVDVDCRNCDWQGVIEIPEGEHISGFSCHRCCVKSLTRIDNKKRAHFFGPRQPREGNVSEPHLKPAYVQEEPRREEDSDTLKFVYHLIGHAKGLHEKLRHVDHKARTHLKPCHEPPLPEHPHRCSIDEALRDLHEDLERCKTYAESLADRMQ